MVRAIGFVLLASVCVAQDDGAARVCPFGQALFGEEEVKIDGNAMVDAYEPGEPPSFTDTAVVRSDQLVRLDGRGRIGGDVISGGAVRRSGNNVIVTGTVTENAESLGFPSLLDWILSKADANDNDSIPRTEGGEVAIRNGGLLVGPNDTLVLPGGDFYFAEVDVRGTLRTSGATRLFVAGRMDVSGQGQLNPGGEPADVYVFSASDLSRAVRFSGQSRSYCLVYGMETEVQVSVSSEVFGAIVAGRVEVAGNAQVHYRAGSAGSCFDVDIETREPSKQFGGTGNAGGNAGGNGNNGVGNGEDPQPPGDPPENDGDGAGPGDPGNRGGGGGGGRGNGGGGGR